MEMMRNPAAMQSALRSQDLMMSQLENHPLGYNALRRLHEEVQAPMMEAASEASVRNPWATGTAVPSTTAPTQAPANPSTSAIPNPWGAPAARPATAPMPMINPFGLPGASAGGMPDMASMMSNPLFQQQMNQMMSNPAFQQQMIQMMSNPAMIQQMAAMNPALAAHINNPQFQALLSNPELLRQMMNPANLQVCCYS